MLYSEIIVYVSATGRLIPESHHVSNTGSTRNDIVLIDKTDMTGDAGSDAASHGAKATVVNATVFYAASGCAVGAVLVMIVAIFIFCRCSSRDQKRHHGNLIRRDNSVFRSLCRMQWFCVGSDDEHFTDVESRM